MWFFRLPPATGGVASWPSALKLGSIAVLVAAFLTIVGLASIKEAPPVEAAVGSGLFVFGASTGAALTHDLASGGNPHFNWAALEPNEGTYSWAALDKALSNARSAGRTMVVRIFTNRSSAMQASPAWFFSSPGASYYYPAGSTHKSPVAWDPVYQQKFGKFLKAFGQRYNGHPQIEFIQIAGVGVYGEMYMGSKMPAGYSAQKHKDAIYYWTDAWRAAFPNTGLALAVNALGSSIGESGAAHAVSRYYVLQMNTPTGNSATRAILSAHKNSTRISIEAENGGCRDATGPGFDNLIDTVFSYDYPVHYLMLCNHSFIDSGTQTSLSYAAGSTNGGTVAPVATSTAVKTSTPVATATQAKATSTPTPKPAQATATATPKPPTPTATPRPATPTPTQSSPWWLRWFR